MRTGPQQKGSKTEAPGGHRSPNQPAPAPVVQTRQYRRRRGGQGIIRQPRRSQRQISAGGRHARISAIRERLLIPNSTSLDASTTENLSVWSVARHCPKTSRLEARKLSILCVRSSQAGLPRKK